MYTVVGNNEKENITVLVTGSAAGDLAPTFILFSGKSLPSNAAAMAPPDFQFGVSDNGWMTAKNFYEYMANCFEPWLTVKGIKRPVLFYLDGHSSHMTLNLSEFCSSHDIILVALYPNSTHLLQPLDVAFFIALKFQWEKTYKEHCKSSVTIGIQKYQFAPLLQKTLNLMDIKKTLKNGFVKCGLHPLDANAIDYNKVLRPIEKKVSDQLPNDITQHSIENVDKLKVLESLLSDFQLSSYNMNTDPAWKGLEADKNLFNIWYSLSHPQVQAANTSIPVVDNIVLEVCIIFHTLRTIHNLVHIHVTY